MFDTTVTPRWLETSDRFWYAYQTREGRRFYLVDPVKKTKAPLFDHAKMAAALTTITRIPYDAQHLPFTQVRFVKNDTAFEFDVAGAARRRSSRRPSRSAITTDQQASGGGERRRATARIGSGERAAGPQQQGQRGARRRRRGAAARRATKTLHFEYDLATAKVTLHRGLQRGAAPPALGVVSPDGKTDRVRAQPQPLHDGRGELREGAEERRTTRPSSRPS